MDEKRLVLCGTRKKIFSAQPHLAHRIFNHVVIHERRDHHMVYPIDSPEPRGIF